jgi:hypothetical protein
VSEDWPYLVALAEDAWVGKSSDARADIQTFSSEEWRDAVLSTVDGIE